jgi:hypothetical protein
MRKQNMMAISLAGGIFLATSCACSAADKSDIFQPSGDFNPTADAGAISPPSAPVADPTRGGFHPFSTFGHATGGDSVKGLLQNQSPYTQFGKDLPPNGVSVKRPPAADAPAVVNSPTIDSSKNKASDEDPARPHDAPIPWADAEKVGREDAAANFSNVIETYLAKHGVHGHWTYASGAKSRVLDFIEVDTKHMQKAGPFYAACASFTEAGSRRRIRLEFTVDFSDAAWRVVSVRPRSRAGPCVD